MKKETYIKLSLPMLTISMTVWAVSALMQFTIPGWNLWSTICLSTAIPNAIFAPGLGMWLAKK